VSRIEESRGLLLDWARWKKSGGTAAENAAAAEIDAVVGTFPESIQSTLLVVYLGGGQMQEHVLRLGCQETTLARRLARADRLLLDQLQLQRDERQRRPEGAEMAGRLSAAKDGDERED
jgi:hypothetical protein